MSTEGKNVEYMTAGVGFRMKINRLCIVTGSITTKEAIIQQIKNTLDDIAIQAVAIDDEPEKVFSLFTDRPKKSDLFLFTSEQIIEDLKKKHIAYENHLYCVCQRSINLDEIEKVISLEKNSKILFVNDGRETTESCIRSLLDYGVNHVEYVPWYPGVIETNEHKTCKVALAAGERNLVPDYIETCIDLGPRVIAMNSLLKIADMIGNDEAQTSRIVNYYFSKINWIAKKMMLLNTEKTKIETLLKEKHEAKGHLASYTFEQILGKSEEIRDTKSRGMKLAKTDLTILLEGESGTGKELFASAIHNASERRNGPFVAVNFSALPDELAESELFGYEEGAFTGAKKGGQVGLFEQADGGTIFLDEIGDISPKMQTKLLRVLQEKEIMPLGGGAIRKVNIRVIAATNKNLKEMVSQNLFRGDLYYRLKIGYIYIPPLRFRKEDVPILAEKFAELEERTVTIEKEVLDVLEEYNWHGNIRELSNTVKYMLAVRKYEDRVVMEDLPDENFFETGSDVEEHPPTMDLEQMDVLRCVWDLKREGGQVGRKRVTEELIHRGTLITESRVRTLLSQLEEMGFIITKRGRQGISVTMEGQKIVMAHLN